MAKEIAILVFLTLSILVYLDFAKQLEEASQPNPPGEVRPTCLYQPSGIEVCESPVDKH